MVRPSINSEKHIVQRSLVSIANGEILNFVFANAVVNPTTPNGVRVGSIIKAVFVEMWIIGSAAQPVVQTSSVEKLVNQSAAMTHVQSQVLHDYPNKKNLFKTSQGILGDANTNTVPIFREWIAIPKGKQRMGLGDSLVFNLATLAEAANDVEVCGLVIFKEYF